MCKKMNQMLKKIKETISGKKFAEKISGADKRVKGIVFLGISGIVLIFLSGFFGSDSTSAKKSETSAPFSSQQYIADLESRIHTIVNEIDGVGDAKVMVTLANTVEYVYESERKETADFATDYQDGAIEKEQAQQEYEKTVVLVDGESGKEALLKTTVEPKVKGVVVVCRGGDDVTVQKQIIDAVTTALGLSSNRVCVVKRTAS